MRASLVERAEAVRMEPSRASEQRAFIGLAVITLLYLVLRAVYVPFIHDEANSFWWYARTGSFFPYTAHENTGNHVLSSFFGWVGQGLFGPQRWALRWGSLLAFPLYAWSCWQFVRRMRRSVPRWTLAFALLWCPFVLDYFALFRGYGLGLACFLWGVVHLVQALERTSVRHAALAGTGFFLATCANLTYVPLWTTCAVGLTAVLLRDRRSRSWPAVVLILVQFALLYMMASLAVHYSRTGQLDFGYPEGILSGTLARLCNTVFGTRGVWCAWLLLTVSIGTTAVAFRASAGNVPLRVACALWWIEVLGRWGMQLFLKIDPPPERAALHLVPLWCLQLGLAIDELSVRDPRWRWAAVALLSFPVSFVLGLNLAVVRGSLEQGVPDRFIERASAMRQHLGRPLVVGTAGAIRSTWAFECLRTGEQVHDPEDGSLLDTPQDLRVLPLEHGWDAQRAGYHLVDSSSLGKLVLLERDRPLQLVTLMDTLLSDVSNDGEFVALFECPPGLMRELLFVRCEGVLRSGGGPCDLRVVCSVLGPDGQLAYDGQELQHEHITWRGERMDVLRVLPVHTDAVRRTCYLWNPAHKHLELRSTRVRVYAVGDDGP